MRHVTLVWLLVFVFCLFVPAQSQTSSPSPVDVAYRSATVEWSPCVAAELVTLTVSGPEGLYLKQDYPSGARLVFSAVDEQGAARPEGTYRWELVVALPGESGVTSRTVSGAFAIQGGIVSLPENEAPVLVDSEAPANSLLLDREGRLGLGTTVPASQLHLKGPEPALTLEDTTTGAALTLRSLEKGDGSLGLLDQATGQARWLVDSEGRVGINTAKPTSTLTVDGYIETTKGFLLDGKAVKLAGSGGPLVAFSVEGPSNNFFGDGAGADPLNTGTQNSFFGGNAGNKNQSGSSNSFFGFSAGAQNTTGEANSFFGGLAGEANTTGFGNSFFGEAAGYSNTEGKGSCFFGASSGFMNTSGNSNSFFGNGAGSENSTGSLNSFFGAAAGGRNTVESSNTLVGCLADLDPGDNPETDPVTNATAVGARAFVAQSNSLVLGSIAGVNDATSNVNVGIGTSSPAYALDVRRTGATAAIVVARTDGAANYMNATATYANFGSANDFPLRLMVNGTWRARFQNDNSLAMASGASCTAGGAWVNASSRDYKENIADLSVEQAVQTLEGLNPVTYTYKADQDEAHVGFIAEDVPELVATKDRKGLSPIDIVAVLTKIVQEQQRVIQDQREAFESLKAEVETLKARLAH